MLQLHKLSSPASDECNLDLGLCAPNSPCGFQAVHVRHGDIKHFSVCPEPVDGSHHLLSIFNYTNDLEFIFQQFDDSSRNDWLDKTVNAPTVNSLTLDQWGEEFRRLKKLNHDILHARPESKRRIHQEAEKE